MPRFFFNLFNDVSACDEEGIDLPDLEAAKRQARVGAAQMIAEQLAAGKRMNPEHRIEVEDEDRRLVHTLLFSDLIEKNA